MSLRPKSGGKTEEALLSEFGVDGAAAAELGGYDEDEEDNEVDLQDRSKLYHW
jgi:hypothetical protein